MTKIKAITSEIAQNQSNITSETAQKIKAIWSEIAQIKAITSEIVQN